MNRALNVSYWLYKFFGSVVMLLLYVVLSKYYLHIHITFGFIQSLNMCSAYLGQWIDVNE